MPKHARPQMCLSTDEHENRVLDVSRHFFGCLRVSERQQFYAALPEKSQRRIRRESRRITLLRKKLECQPQTKAGTLLTGFKETISDWRGLHGWMSVEDQVTTSLPHNPDNSVDGEIKASMIFFKDSRPYDIPGVENTFPNQKIPIRDLLADEQHSNPIMKPCDDNMIRYFHLPANNMIWVEELMARYYHEERPDAEDLFLKSKLGRERTKTEMLLAPEFWQGQQNFGDNSEVHSRHMRPLCDVISTNPISTEPLPRNLVLFMPYLHWETDRGRLLSAAAVKAASIVKPSIAEIVDQAKAANEQNSHPNLDSEAQNDLDQNQVQDRPMSAATSAHKRKVLGEVLRQAAALMEAIDCRIEESLIQEYLHKRPPLHPRRTLDQSYYVGLKDTASRDRDQVVYRATIPGEHDCEDHIDMNDPWGRCRQCQEDSRKVPRLIMVDQLWLWILDDRTVITCFPRRWGKIRPDSSAVHKSLRMRLKTARKDEIRSSYDLALIIIDECSRVFFDRTKTADRQPNLVDMFAGAIRDITYSQTAAFDLFLFYTHLASKEYNTRSQSGSNATENALLNINPEGKLLKEIKDILDELHILTQVNLQQQTVAISFVKHIREFLLPHLKSRSTWHPVISLYEDEDDNESESGQRERRESARLTVARADHLLADMHERIGELKMLEENARKTATALKDILALKQQQAAVIEAREAVRQATETLKQGKSIMLFTVVTIVFLPLSFCTSVFGMNTAEFNTGSLLTLTQEITYAIPISATIILVSFLLAFSRSSALSSLFMLLSAIIHFPLSVFATWFFTKSGLYALTRAMWQRANALREKENTATAVLKADAMRVRVGQRGLGGLYPGAMGRVVEAGQGEGGGVEKGGRTPRGTPMGTPMETPMATPMLGSRRTGFRGAGFSGAEEDVERGKSSGSGSMVGLVK